METNQGKNKKKTLHVQQNLNRESFGNKSVNNSIFQNVTISVDKIMYFNIKIGQWQKLPIIWKMTHFLNYKRKPGEFFYELQITPFNTEYYFILVLLEISAIS